MRKKGNDVAKLVAKAERTLAADRSGWDSPHNDMLLRTAICAVEAAIACNDMDCAAECYVMLRLLHQRLYGVAYNPADDEALQDAARKLADYIVSKH